MRPARAHQTGHPPPVALANLVEEALRLSHIY